MYRVLAIMDPKPPIIYMVVVSISPKKEKSLPCLEGDTGRGDWYLGEAIRFMG